VLRDQAVAVELGQSVGHSLARPGSRRIVGWSMAAHMRQELVVDALTMAVKGSQAPGGNDPSSDHGGQFAGLTFGHACHDAGIAQSMGTVGTCDDNAVAKPFFATLTAARATAGWLGDPRSAGLGDLRVLEGFYSPTSGCTARSGCAPPTSTRPTTPPATPTASRAHTHTRTRSKN
jgi:transposase InsO family protein